MKPRIYSTTVLVAGAGMAGLCAGISALERGAQVLVIEKSDQPGGSMAMSNGLIWTLRSKDEVRRQVPQGDEALQDLLVDGLTESLDWLVQQGAQLEPMQTVLGHGFGRRASGGQLTAALTERATAMGANIMTGVSLQSLLTENGAVVGALAFDANGPIEIRAASVILTTGGFQGNCELVTRYITPHADALYLRSNPNSTGDGLLAALDVGAATTPWLNAFYGHAMNAPPARFDASQFQNMSHKYGQMAVALNLSGRRFADESAGTGEELLNAHLSRQSGATAAYVVDAAIGELSYEVSALPRVVIERARQAGARVVQANTLEELAQGMQAWGIPSAHSLQTLQDYNAAIKAGTGAALHPPRVGNAFALETPPFSAVLVRASITYTCGGLRTDLDMRVLRRATSVSMMPLAKPGLSEWRTGTIAGLYAAGCDMGGISIHGYLGGLAQALVTGRAAGSAAAADSC